jgi:hypothetical protein
MESSRFASLFVSKKNSWQEKKTNRYEFYIQKLQTESRENYSLYRNINKSVSVAGIVRGLGLKWRVCI